MPGHDDYDIWQEVMDSFYANMEKELGKPNRDVVVKGDKLSKHERYVEIERLETLYNMETIADDERNAR